MCENQCSKSRIIIELPGTINRSRCSKCNSDLTELLQAFILGEIDQLAHCPECGTQLRQDNMTQLAYRCSKCNERVIDPQTAKHCTGCGRHFQRQIKTEA